MPDTARRRVLTGDTPTGSLHVGHWVGSVKRRVEFQETHDCFFLVANLHAFTTRADKPEDIRRDCMEVVRDALAMGIDPEKASIFLQTEVPAILELTYLFSMLLPYNRVMRNPTLKDELKVKGLEDNYSFGFPLHGGADRGHTGFQGTDVPVGEDQVPHLELTREVARRFNKFYCGVPEKATRSTSILVGSSRFEADVGKVGRLVGTDGIQKMSKSLGNSILITDTPKQVKKKLGRSMLVSTTSSPTIPARWIPKNPLFKYVETFIDSEDEVAELRIATHGATTSGMESSRSA